MGPVMPDIPPTTSASQLTAYSMCPRLYAMRYVYHVDPEFRSLNLALGSAERSFFQLAAHLAVLMRRLRLGASLIL